MQAIFTPFFFDLEVLQPLIKLYELDIEEIQAESPLVKRTLSKASIMQEISDVLLEIAPFQAAFPGIVNLLQLVMKICVSSAECEQCFSASKQIKSYLRCYMSEQSLTNYGVLSIERDISDKLNLGNFVDAFAHVYHRIVLK